MSIYSVGPAGSNGQVQFNDNGGFSGDVDLTYNKTTNALTVGGDVNLNDGGSFTTTLQTITATADRTISLPNATGTVALVAGSSGQLVYNNAGAQAGAPGSVVGATGDVTLGLNGAASTPPLDITGTWFTGGTATTTKPQVLIEPTGTTSNTWSPDGTGLGVNAASTFTGRLLDLQRNGTSRAVVTGAGQLLVGTATSRSNFWNGSINSAALQIEGTDYNGASLSLVNNNANDGDAGSLIIAKSGGASVGSNTIVANGEVLGGVVFQGNDGTEFVAAALISAAVDGVPGANDMPGRLVFSTTPDGASTATERMRIKSNGIVNIGNTPTYADNAAATAGGLVAGDIYRTSTGQLMIRF